MTMMLVSLVHDAIRARGTTTEPTLKHLFPEMEVATMDAILDVFEVNHVIQREGVAVRYLGF